MVMWNIVKANERTDLYRQALGALQKLADAESPDKMERAFGEMASLWRQRAEEREYRASRGQGCLERIRSPGYRCLHRYDNEPGHGPPIRGYRSRVLRRRSDGQLAYTVEIYNLGWDRLQVLVDFARENRLCVDLRPALSLHWPGRSVQAVFTSEEVAR